MIYNFNEYFLNERNVVDNEKDEITVPKRVSTTIFKKFFKELKEHVMWWFKNDFISDKFILESADDEKRSCSFWFYDKTENDDPTYMYKLKYSESEPRADLDKVENCLFILKIYTYEDQSLLKEMELRIPIKYINADFLDKKINQLKKRIIKDPKDKDEKEDFLSKQARHLDDNIY